MWIKNLRSKTLSSHNPLLKIKSAGSAAQQPETQRKLQHSVKPKTKTIYIAVDLLTLALNLALNPHRQRRTD
jgi:hypothetical protein